MQARVKDFVDNVKGAVTRRASVLKQEEPMAVADAGMRTSRRGFLSTLAGGAVASTVPNWLSAGKADAGETKVKPLSEETRLFSSDKWKTKDFDGLLGKAYEAGYIPESELARITYVAKSKGDFDSLRKTLSLLDHYSHHESIKGDYRLDQRDIHDLIRNTKDFGAALGVLRLYALRQYPDIQLHGKRVKGFTAHGLEKYELKYAFDRMKEHTGLNNHITTDQYQRSLDEYITQIAEISDSSLKARQSIDSEELFALVQELGKSRR